MFGNPIVPLWPSVQFQFQHHKVEWGLQPNYKKGMSRAVVKTSPACFGVFTLLWVWQSFKMWKLSASAHGVREPPHISFQLKKKNKPYYFSRSLVRCFYVFQFTFTVPRVICVICAQNWSGYKSSCAIKFIHAGCLTLTKVFVWCRDTLRWQVITAHRDMMVTVSIKKWQLRVGCVFSCATAC